MGRIEWPGKLMQVMRKSNGWRTNSWRVRITLLTHRISVSAPWGKGTRRGPAGAPPDENFGQICNRYGRGKKKCPSDSQQCGTSVRAQFIVGGVEKQVYVETLPCKGRLSQ